MVWIFQIFSGYRSCPSHCRMVVDAGFALEEVLITCLDFLFHVHVLVLVHLYRKIIEQRIDSCYFASPIVVFFSDIDFFHLDLGRLLYFIEENNFCLNWNYKTVVDEVVDFGTYHFADYTLGLVLGTLGVPHFGRFFTDFVFGLWIYPVDCKYLVSNYCSFVVKIGSVNFCYMLGWNFVCCPLEIPIDLLDICCFLYLEVHFGQNPGVECVIDTLDKEDSVDVVEEEGIESLFAVYLEVYWIAEVVQTVGKVYLVFFGRFIAIANPSNLRNIIKRLILSLYSIIDFLLEAYNFYWFFKV